MRFNLNLEHDTYKKLETVIGDFEKINEQFQAQKSEACVKFKTAFELFMKDFFTLVPMVKQVRWDQYTPYFNDGDSCTFSVNEPYFSNFIHDSDDFDDEEEEDTKQKQDNWEISTWDIRDKEYEQYGMTEEQKNLVQYVNDIIYGNEEFFYDIFGDHQQIVITKDGITHDYYEHD